MKKSTNRSCIEIWSSDYVNNIDNREPEDRNVTILQVCRGNRGPENDDYIIEFVRPMGDRVRSGTDA